MWGVDDWMASFRYGRDERSITGCAGVPDGGVVAGGWARVSIW